MEIERAKRPVIIVGHQAVLRVIYSYFVEENLENVPHSRIPLHTVIKLVPQTYDVVENRVEFDIEQGTWKEL